jgi:O-antigen biosynthesis protein WbqP
MFYYLFKRIFDVFMSLFVLIFLSPLFLLISFLIFFQDYNKIIFQQIRIGKNGVKFTFYKFRTMPINTPNVTSDRTDYIKITKIGKILRRTNMDELPQFFNVIKGDMSVIGPRPALPSQSLLIKLREENGASKLKPGLTGWAQVNSYDNMTENKKAELDGEYFKNHSFYMDLKIFFKTIIYFTKKPPTY